MHVLKRDAEDGDPDRDGLQPLPELSGRSLLRLSTAARQEVEQRPAAHDPADGGLGQELDRPLVLLDAQREPAE